ncbi:hypothetical protein FB45DRAFT_1006943 [Roridomyces roridus]|uniref:Uncharacterized protein n=1 Tax=Roridomyces roridus TaxID=1738132 RepID=A0AAD7BGW9_9AGAR|nr:hypothetical protein FB45DRAFT_1006943 [Roridomyces roridus]
MLHLPFSLLSQILPTIAHHVSASHNVLWHARLRHVNMDAATSYISLAWVLDSGLHTRNFPAAGLLALPYDGGVFSMSTELAISASLSHDLVLGLDWYSSVCTTAPQILGLLTLAALDLHLPLSTAVSGSVSVMPDAIVAPASHSSTPSTRGVDDVSTPRTRRVNTRTRDVLDNNDFITHENETVTSSFHDPFVMLSNSDKTLVICYHVNEKCVPAAELRKLVAHHQVNIYKIAETLRFEFIGRKYARSAGLYTAGGSSFFSSTARVFPRPCNWSPIPRKRPRLPLATDSTLSEFPIILTRQQKDDIVTEFRAAVKTWQPSQLNITLLDKILKVQLRLARGIIQVPPVCVLPSPPLKVNGSRTASVRPDQFTMQSAQCSTVAAISNLRYSMHDKVFLLPYSTLVHFINPSAE